MPYRVICFPIRTAAAIGAVRRVRRARRAATAVAAKPTIVWVCLTLPFALPLAALPFRTSPLPPSPYSGGPSAGDAIAGAESLRATSPRRGRQIPEPASALLLAGALAAMAAWRIVR